MSEGRAITCESFQVRRPVLAQTDGFFVFNTNLTFLYSSDTKGFKKLKNKIASSGIWTHYHWIRILTALPIQPPRHLLNRKSLNWSWIISRINRARLYELQIGWVGKAVRILIQWWLLLWVQIPQEAILFFYFVKPFVSILYRNVRFGWKRKTRMSLPNSLSGASETCLRVKTWQYLWFESHPWLSCSNQHISPGNKKNYKALEWAPCNTSESPQITFINRHKWTRL